MNSRVELFGCKIDRLRMTEAVDRVFGMVDSPSATCRYVVTPNVDHVVMLQHHHGLQRAYEDADLVLADGMPLVLASRLLRHSLPERVAGSDLVELLFAQAATRRILRIFMVGAAPAVAKLAAENIQARWPAIQIVGMLSPPLGFEHDQNLNTEILEHIADASPDLLLLGLGAPKQELWVHAHRHGIRAAVALCAGATIDFLAGHKRRAPHWMRRSGLEWLHRLASEPRRLVRRYARDAWYFPGIIRRELHFARKGKSRLQ